MARYVKVIPTVDDIGKTPIVVTDETGVNGVAIEFSEALNISELADDTILWKTTVADVPVLISKTVAEMKTALGLPKNIYVAKWYQSGETAPILSSTRVNTFTTSPIVSFTRDSAGVFGMTTTGLETASVADIEFRDMDETDTKYIKGGYVGAIPYLYVREKATGNAIDGFTIIITIKQWA